MIKRKNSNTLERCPYPQWGNNGSTQAMCVYTGFVDEGMDFILLLYILGKVYPNWYKRKVEMLQITINYISSHFF